MMRLTISSAVPITALHTFSLANHKRPEVQFTNKFSILFDILIFLTALMI